MTEGNLLRSLQAISCAFLVYSKKGLTTGLLLYSWKEYANV